MRTKVVTRSYRDGMSHSMYPSKGGLTLTTRANLTNKEIEEHLDSVLPGMSFEEMGVYFQAMKRYGGHPAFEAVTADGIKLVVKYDQDDLNEYNIGREVNKVTTVIPNFAYTYASFKCPGPSKVNNRWKACGAPEGSAVYFTIQYIKGVEFGDFIKGYPDKVTIEEIVSIMVQVSYAIEYAAQTIGFYHGDLHFGNVMIVENDLGSITYPAGSTEKVFTGRYYPVIIDYGKSMIGEREHGDVSYFRSMFMLFANEHGEYGLGGVESIASMSFNAGKGVERHERYESTEKFMENNPKWSELYKRYKELIYAWDPDIDVSTDKGRRQLHHHLLGPANSSRRYTAIEYAGELLKRLPKVAAMFQSK